MTKVLIIDDTRTVHNYVKMICKGLSLEFISVFNGEEALILLDKQHDFDAIFLDWEMPVLDGPSTLKKLQDLGILIPTIMMTTKNSENDILRMLELGAMEYMMKPFTVDILKEKLEYVVGHEVCDVA